MSRWSLALLSSLFYEAVGALHVESAVHLALREASAVSVMIELAHKAELGAVSGPTEVHHALRSHAAASQAGVVAELRRHGVEFEAFHIANAVFAKDVSQACLLALADSNTSARVRLPVDGHLVGDLSNQEPRGGSSVNGSHWNLAAVGATDAWQAGYDGKGVVVGNIDSGVRFSHRDLADGYRGTLPSGAAAHDYNWHDCQGAAAPTDGVGHGTGTMGLLVGRTTGVAPGAKWIAARACTGQFCSEAALLKAAQWMLCPTKRDGSAADCSKAPHVVSNSWVADGGKSHVETYLQVVSSWRKAGIIPVFAIGNVPVDAHANPHCGSANSPGDYADVIGIGATDKSGKNPGWACRGPGQYVVQKPDFATPGSSGGYLDITGVQTTWNTDDDAIKAFAGTSAATPQAAGVVALIYGSGAKSYDAIYHSLQMSSSTDLGQTADGFTECSGVSYDMFPNYFYGHGLPNACRAISGCASLSAQAAFGTAV